jgi:hypothetical protein
MSQPDTEQAVISSDGVTQFIRDGFVVIRDVLSANDVENAILLFKDKAGLDMNDPDTWTAERSGNLGEKGMSIKLQHLFTPVLEQACKQLAGPDVICRGFTPVVKLPAKDNAKPPHFAPSGFHIDGVRQGLTIYPTMRSMVVFLYLQETSEIGGATAIRPGSHRTVFEYAHKDGIDLSGNWKEDGVTSAPDLDYRDPIPFVGNAGDALIFHYLATHGGSANFSERPRIGLNGTVQQMPDKPYQPKSGSPDASWTAIDYTLRTDTLK